jgi:hypothetical protein
VGDGNPQQTPKVKFATWAKVYYNLPEVDQRQVCDWAGWPYTKTEKVPISDLEVHAIRVLHDLGWHGLPWSLREQMRRDGHITLEPDNFRYYLWQVPVPSTQLTIDLGFPDGTLVELYGCGYHQCATCQGETEWWPGIRAADIDRRNRINRIMGRDFEIIWNHEWHDMTTIFTRILGEVEENMQAMIDNGE